MSRNAEELAAALEVMALKLRNDGNLWSPVTQSEAWVLIAEALAVLLRETR